MRSAAVPAVVDCTHSLLCRQTAIPPSHPTQFRRFAQQFMDLAGLACRRGPHVLAERRVLGGEPLVYPHGRYSSTAPAASASAKHKPLLLLRAVQSKPLWCVARSLPGVFLRCVCTLS